MQRILCALLAVSLSVCAPPANTAEAAKQPPATKAAPDPAWSEINKLISEQKLEAASEMVAKLREAATKKNDDAEITRCLIKEVQLRLGLHGYETSVRFLREQPWPKAPLSRVALNLYYGSNLLQYLQAYSWEINQREKVATMDVVDLKAWTRDQLFAEALRAYNEVWAMRAQLGTEPRATLNEYISPGDFPDRIRGTLRDSLTYLTVELVRNTSFWSPAQSNDIYQLGFDKLLKGGAAREIKLNDASLHPIEVAAQALEDLEAWHKAAGRTEAAYEAHLQRYDLLFDSFTNKADRDQVLQALEASQKAMRALEWWAEGQAQLAEWVRDHLGDRVRAKAIAEEGVAAYKDTYGGHRCASIISEILSPAYQLQTMTHDGIDKRSVSVSHKNVEHLWFRAYRRDLIATIESRSDYSLLPDYRDVTPMLKEKPAYSWDLALPKAVDYQMHTTFMTPPIKEKGLWVVVASVREDFSLAANKVSSINIIVTDLVLLARQNQESGRMEVSVVEGETGKPVPGAKVMLYMFDWQKKHHEVDSAKTDSAGYVSFKAKQGQSVFVNAKRDRDFSLDPQAQYFYQYQKQKPRGDLVFTDRAIYRPEQTLNWKVVSYDGNLEHTQYKVLPNTDVIVYFRDANQQVVEQRVVKTNDFGSASGSFAIPKGRLLGAWTVATAFGHAGVQIEEYKRPTFEMTLKPNDAEARINQPVTVKGEAKYYFGLPVATGAIKWRVTRERNYPWWWFWFYWGGGSGGTQQIAAGNTTLKPDGTFEITFKPEADEREGKALTYTYSLSADLTDEGGETRSAQRAFRLGFISVEANVWMAHGFFLGEEDVKLDIKRSNLDGVGQAGTANARVFVVKQPSKPPLPADLANVLKKDAFSTPGDALKPRFTPDLGWEQVTARWEDGAEVTKATLTHDKEGNATFAIGKLAPGLYRLRYDTLDAFGAKYETFKTFIVAGKTTPLALPFLIIAYESTLSPGQTAHILLHTGLKDQPLTWERTHGSDVVERKWLSGNGLQLIDIPIKNEDRGGFGLQSHLLRDYQMLQGQAGIYVPWDDKALDVSFSTFRDLLRPGQKETWRVTVKAKESKKVEARTAEILAYMYDKSLELFAPHHPTSALGLYPTFTWMSLWRANLALGYEAANLGYSWYSVPGYPTYTPAALMFYASYGIGGMGRRHGGPMRSAHRAAMRDGDDRREMEDAPGAPAAEADAAPAKMKKESSGERMKADEGVMGFAASNAPAPPPPPPKDAPPQMRSNFAETAFFAPHLITNDDGSASVELTVPDSVTAYRVWAVALTRDLRSGEVNKEAKAVKELMVRPYMPRFMREGDSADLKIVVNNAGAKEMKGEVTLDIIDPETQKSVAADFGLVKGTAAFTVAPNGGANVSFSLVAPKKVGIVAFRVVAKAGEWSDGELRPIPVLPSRMHLAQSRFVTLRDKQSRTMRFEDLIKNDDPTLINEKLVVTLDAQLFYTVLKALPYLLEYPYECAEQTLNRFVSAGILSSLYKQIPAVAEMAKTMSERKTRLETFDAPDPNRRMTLEESPWLQEAKGGEDIPNTALANVLDPEVARATRARALGQLAKMQLPSGAFPWFPGGPPSPWITLYLMHGFAKATEFQVEVPKDMVVRGWSYLAGYFRNEVRAMMALDCCWELISFLNYTLTAYPDQTWGQTAFDMSERKEMLEFSFRHWKQHAPMMKAYLALTLKRMDRLKDGQLVFASVMDSAKTKEDQGTFWAPEDRSWLWYNDTIESHALALRTLTELQPENPKRDGLVLWLLLNKKLNHWKSTRATAEVIYSLAHYMKADHSLGVREAATVTIGDEKQDFVFEPNKYVGKTQIVVPAEKVTPKSAEITVAKETKGFMFASATWHFSTDKLPREERGDFFNVKRTYFKRENDGKEWTLKPLAEGAVLKAGDEVEVQISLRSKHEAEYVHLRDPRGAGFEPEGAVSKYHWDLGLVYYEEFRDSGTNFFFEKLPVGEYTFKYRVRVAMAGTFRVGPAVVQAMYAPEFVAYSAGNILKVAK